MTTCSKPLLCGIPFPGVDEDIATTMAAEMGIRTEQFADGPHLASWTAMCPGNHGSRDTALWDRRIFSQREVGHFRGRPKWGWGPKTAPRSKTALRKIKSWRLG